MRKLSSNRRNQRDSSSPKARKTVLVVLTCIVIISLAIRRGEPELSVFVSDVDFSSLGFGTVGGVTRYTPSKIESYFLDHAHELGLDNATKVAVGCKAWKDKSSPIAAELVAFRRGMQSYQKNVTSFKAEVTDLRKHIEHDHRICDSLELHPDGLKGFFTQGSLSQTTKGLLEPLFPPMRSPDLCFDRTRAKLMSLDYLVHDFSAYCRRLKPTSRIILLDMGASLDFHGGGEMPAVYLTKIYQQFGFHWDHIYAYEITQKTPADVFKKVPQELTHAYHWINVGVNPTKGSKMNPWTMLLREYNEDDFGTLFLGVASSRVLLLSFDSRN